MSTLLKIQFSLYKLLPYMLMFLFIFFTVGGVPDTWRAVYQLGGVLLILQLACLLQYEQQAIKQYWKMEAPDGDARK